MTTGRYSDHDHEHYERPRRRTRPRTKDRPSYDDAVDARVVTVDRGRFTLLLDGHRVMAMKSRPLGRKGVVVGDHVRVLGDTSGVAHIRGHETDRLTALATELGRLGAHVTEREDGLSIRPAPLHGGTFRTYADHRMAHAGVILGLVVDDVLVEDIGTTAKTFPDFAGAWSLAVHGGAS